jgi:RNA polymerase sigma-70 factor (ECF subfamily)
VNTGFDGSGAGSSCAGTERTSSTLLERAQAGDQESCGLLWRIYGPLVRKKYLAIVPAQDRDDLCQEVFLTLFEHINEFHKTHHDGPCFRPWLKEITFNKVGNYLKRKHRDRLTVSNFQLDALAPGVFHCQDDSDAAREDEQIEVARAAFEEAVSQVERRTEEAARRVVLETEPVAVVARDLGMTHNAVYIARSRVLARIRAILTELGEPAGTAAGPPDRPDR